ncbi:transcription termination factor MTERF15 protein [Thalictrum thalictroides]|uniref:Transcription termination factor MTERF15 protein n=1 Tax=Thalictrum thalictroides TaxID=46969 RepID=A0A7J6V197_THATH|nr:transcription termination factor MTERF15 protein [Thalictrum thalictroides]
MALRFLTRLMPHRLISNFPSSLSYPDQRVRFFSPKCSTSFQISSKFAEKSQYRERILLANLLQRYGFPPSHLHDFIGKNRFLLNCSLVDVEKSLGILLLFKISQKSIVSILSTCPGVLELGFLKKWEVGFSQLGIGNVSPMLIQSVLEHSIRFNIEPTDVCRCLSVLKDLGFSVQTVTKVIEGFPRVITMKLRDIEQRVDFLKGVRLPWKEIDGICYFFPMVLGLSVEDRLKPLFAEFGSLGFNANEVRNEIIVNPQILGMEVGELSRCVDLLKSLKCRLAVEEKILSKGALRAGFEVKSRVDCLCRHGMIPREAFKVVYKEPRVILYDLEDIEKKIEFLKLKMGFNIGCLVEVPEYLGVNFDKQIVLRYNVLEYLRSKGGLGCEVGLKGMIKPSRLRFFNLYVKPYPECEKIFGRFSRDNVVKPQRPVGLWKLFKPQSYPDTKEELRNIKIHMESVG